MIAGTYNILNKGNNSCISRFSIHYSIEQTQIWVTN